MKYILTYVPLDSSSGDESESKLQQMWNNNKTAYPIFQPRKLSI